MFQYWKLKQYIEERGVIQKFVAKKPIKNNLERDV